MPTIINGTSNAITFPDSTVQNTAALVSGGTIASATITALNTNGVTFPATQSPSSDANTLDDYEEGTWTATLTSATGSNPTVSGYNNQTGQYVKVGGLVFVSVNMGAVLSGGSGQMRIAGLPFTSLIGSSPSWYAATMAYNNQTGGTVPTSPMIGSGNTYIQMWRESTNCNWGSTTNVDWYVTAVYRSNS